MTLNFLGLDIGTTGCKAVVFDENLVMLYRAYREYDLTLCEGDGLELDPLIVWKNVRKVLKEANANVPGVKALAISAVGDIVIPLSEKGAPIRPSIVDFDPRGQEEIDSFSREFGAKKLYGITGMPPLFINSLSKILWYQRHEPDTFKSVARWSTYEDFLLERLGMPPVASHSVAARTMLMDIRAKAWSHEVLSAAGIDPAKLPALLPSGGIVGQLDPEIAEALGFVGETTVCSGGHDMVCAAVGAGLTADDTEAAVDIDGTMEGIVVCMKHANTSDVMFENRYPCYPGYDGYVTFSVNLTGSSMLKWFRDELSRDLVSEALEKEIDVYDLILKDLNPATPSGLLFLPQWSGSGNPYFDPNAKGMIYGLTLNTRRRDLAQGLIEGLCYDVNVQLEQFQRAGIKITKLLCVGGGSRSKSKLQMKANITGLEMINVPVIEASALGAAVMAAKGVGVLSEPLEAIKKAAPNQDRFVPSGAGRRQFAQSFQNYKELNRIKHEFENKS